MSSPLRKLSDHGGNDTSSPGRSARGPGGRRTSELSLGSHLARDHGHDESKSPKQSPNRPTSRVSSLSPRDDGRDGSGPASAQPVGRKLSGQRNNSEMICFSPKRSSFIPSFSRKKSASPSIVLDMEAPLSPRSITRDRSVSSPVRPNFDVGAFLQARQRNEPPPLLVNDTVVLDYSSSSKPMSTYYTEWRNPVCQGALPSGRLNHVSAVLDGKMYMFGGTDGESLKNQLFVLDLQTFTWSNPQTSGTAPPHRYGHSCTAVGTQLFVFGGKGKDTVFADMHVLDTTTMTWYEVECDPMQGRAYHNAWYYHGDLFVVGGQLYNGLTCSTMAKFNVGRNRWTEVALDDFKGRAMAACLPLGKGKAAIVGGIRSSKALFGSEVVSKYCTGMQIINGPKRTVTAVKLSKDLCVAGAACTGYGRSVILSGGTRKGKAGPAATVVVVDVKTGQWVVEDPSTESGNPPPRLTGHSAVTLGDSLYFFGGKAKDGVASNVLYWLKVGSRKSKTDHGDFSAPSSRLTHSSSVERADLAEVTIVKRLATGGSGSVHLASWKGEMVVLKKYFRFDPEAFDKEVAVLASVSHRNVVQFLSAGVDDEQELGVLLEYLPLGDLSSVLQSNGPLSWRQALAMGRQVAGCMRYLHSLNIIHRDLKSSNLLVASLNPEEEVMIKVMDFGDAHELSHHKREEADACIGTTRWTAPEVLEQRSTCNTKSDVYSFAIILWEMVTGSLPYYEVAKDWHVQKLVAEGGRPTIPEDWPVGYKALVESCWHGVPENRPSFEMVEKILTELEERQKQSEERATLERKAAKRRERKRGEREGHSRNGGGGGGGGGLPHDPLSPRDHRGARRKASAGAGGGRKKVAAGTARTDSRSTSLGSAVNISEASLMLLDPDLVAAKLRKDPSPRAITVSSDGISRQRAATSTPGSLTASSDHISRERGRHRSSSRKKSAEALARAYRDRSASSASHGSHGSSSSSSSNGSSHSSGSSHSGGSRGHQGRKARSSSQLNHVGAALGGGSDVAAAVAARAAKGKVVKKSGSDPVDAGAAEKRGEKGGRTAVRRSSGDATAAGRHNSGPAVVKATSAKRPTQKATAVARGHSRSWKDELLSNRRTSSPSSLRLSGDHRGREKDRTPKARLPSPLTSPSASPSPRTTRRPHYSSTSSDVCVVDDERSDTDDALFLMDDEA